MSYANKLHQIAKNQGNFYKKKRVDELTEKTLEFLEKTAKNGLFETEIPLTFIDDSENFKLSKQVLKNLKEKDFKVRKEKSLLENDLYKISWKNPKKNK